MTNLIGNVLADRDISSMALVLSSILLLLSFFCHSQEVKDIYLIPGHGSDERIFSKIEFPPGYKIHHIVYDIPRKNESLGDYAMRISEQIDLEKNFILIGVSLGGMIATEIAELTNPTQTIIISSAKNVNELPGRYRFQKSIPLYKLVGPRLAKGGAKVLQPIVEPDRNNEKEVFKLMLDAKNPLFMKRAIGMIITWDRESNSRNIIHIHGDNDKTIPSRNTDYDYLIPGGSHMITLTRAGEISEILNLVIANSERNYDFY